MASDQTDLATKTAELSSGKRVVHASDDPIAWAAAQRATVQKTLTGGTTAALETARDRLAETDSALGSIGDAVSQARALAVQGANASYSPEARKELGVQVRALFEGALRAANQQAPNGEYLLGGTSSLSAPFDPNGVYVGDATARTLDDGAYATVDGARLTAANGVDVLPLLGKLATALETNDTTTLSSTIADLQTAVQQVGLARTRGGAASAVVDTTLTANQLLADNLSGEIAKHVEIDPVAAATDLSRASQALEASRLVSSHLASLLDPRNMGL